MRIVNLYFTFVIVLVPFLINGQITTTATVNHATPNSTTSLGSINLNVSGGTSPYTYSWVPSGATTKDITNSTRNNYSVKVKGSSNDSVSYYFSLGYKTKWINLVGSTYKNDTISPISGVGYSWPFAVSKNTLLPNTDGWAEMVLQPTTNYVMMGFHDSTSMTNHGYFDIDCGFYKDMTYIYAIVNGGIIYLLNTAKAGDAVKIERVGTTFNIKVNNVVKYTTSVSASKNWKLKAALHLNYITNVGTSFMDSTGVYFPNYVQQIPLIKHCTVGQNNGSISLVPRVNGTTNTYLWATTSYTTATVNNLAPGVYSVDTKDSHLNWSKQNYEVGFKTKWTNFIGSKFRNDTVSSTSTGQSWPNAVSKNTLKANADGWASVIFQANSDYFMLGFHDSTSVINHGYTDIDYGIYKNLSLVYAVVNGNFILVMNNAKDGDQAKIERIGNTFKLKVNDIAVYTTMVSTAKNWKLKLAVHLTSISNIGASFIDSTSTDFPNYLQQIPNITHCTPGENDGAINIIPAIGGSIQTYSWVSGASSSTSSLTNLSSGEYTVMIYDSDLNNSTQKYMVGSKTRWINFYGAKISTDTISILPGYSWVSAYSENILSPSMNGYAEAVNQPGTNYLVIGFQDSTYSTTTSLDVDYGFYKALNQLQAIVAGVSYNITNNIKAGDIVNIERVGSVFNLKLNSVTVYTSSISATTKFKLKAMVYSNSVSNISASFLPPSLNLTSSINNIHYSILNRKLDAGYYNSITNGNKYFYFKFDEEYYVPTSTNLTYKIFNDAGNLITTTPTMVETIGDNRFALNVNSLTAGNYYKIYVYNQKNEVWEGRIKIN